MDWKLLNPIHTRRIY